MSSGIVYPDQYILNRKGPVVFSVQSRRDTTIRFQLNRYDEGGAFVAGNIIPGSDVIMTVRAAPSEEEAIATWTASRLNASRLLEFEINVLFTDLALGWDIGERFRVLIADIHVRSPVAGTANFYIFSVRDAEANFLFPFYVWNSATSG